MDVILFQMGPFHGLRYCMESIACHSPNSKIHLVGDAVPDYGYHPWTLFAGESAELDKTYVHHSPNPDHFELRCLKRWFVIYNFAKKMGINEFFTCDTDVLVMGNLGEESVYFRPCDFTMPLGSSFIFNVDKLGEFCEFILKHYREPNEFRTQLEADYEAKRISAISDMQLIDHFCRGCQTIDASHYLRNPIIDANLALVNEFTSCEGYKRVQFLYGKPYGKRLDGTIVRFLALHCWGKAKARMAWYFNESLKSL